MSQFFWLKLAGAVYTYYSGYFCYFCCVRFAIEIISAVVGIPGMPSVQHSTLTQLGNSVPYRSRCDGGLHSAGAWRWIYDK